MVRLTYPPLWSHRSLWWSGRSFEIPLAAPLPSSPLGPLRCGL